MYIDIDAIDNKRNVIDALKRIPTANAPSRASRYTRKGDVIFSMVRPYLKNIAMVNCDQCIASTGFYVCSSNGCIDDNYNYYLLLSDYVVMGLNHFMKGDNSPSITKKEMDNFCIPIPPLAEQKRIVKTLCKTLKAIDAMTENL